MNFVINDCFSYVKRRCKDSAFWANNKVKNKYFFCLNSFLSLKRHSLGSRAHPGQAPAPHGVSTPAGHTLPFASQNVWFGRAKRNVSHRKTIPFTNHPCSPTPRQQKERAQKARHKAANATSKRKENRALCLIAPPSSCATRSIFRCSC